MTLRIHPKTLMLTSMKYSGFTLVELVITVTIMTILLSLAAVSLTSTLANQRDAERASDINTIANNLENYYKVGNGGSTTNRYPSTALLASGATSIKSFFPRADIDTFTAPDTASVSVSFIPATNAVATVAGVTPQPTKSQFVYQPIQNNGTLCTAESQECRRFNLFYRTEIDNTVKKFISKHQ